ncbi:AraC family transcriptional regulator [Maridesulfovibrio bastinii]|uniref:AraC family transcriptional regulator n=1 Tax=Maridesulfovibrio bastinii TaxID=47157 RepID=UPI000402053B|nr:AraC family transcriptional regulator [Maridesulfovibrio bastinii]
MVSKQQNSFEFKKAESPIGMTVLNAVMTDFSYSEHAHEEIAVGVTLSGIQEFTCNGSLFRSHPGDILIFNPGDVHNGHPGDNDALKYTMLYLDRRDFYALAASTVDKKQPCFRMPETNFRDNVLKKMILEMSGLVSPETSSGLEYEQLQYEIAKHFSRRLGIFIPDAFIENKDSLLLRARDYILDNITRDISIEELCSLVNISKFHFIRLFRSQFGMTPHKYILNQKINMVRQALKTGAPPSMVAQDFGFFDASHMNRHFKRTYGITPKQYQRQLFKRE